MKAVISPKNPTLIATLDPAIIQTGKMNLYELAQSNGYQGSVDAFLAQFRIALNSLDGLISLDKGNYLTLGQDGKLYIQNPLTKQDW